MTSEDKATPLWRSLANSAAAASIAEATTLPLDTAKVWQKAPYRFSAIAPSVIFMQIVEAKPPKVMIDWKITLLSHGYNWP